MRITEHFDFVCAGRYTKLDCSIGNVSSVLWSELWRGDDSFQSLAITGKKYLSNNNQTLVIQSADTAMDGAKFKCRGYMSAQPEFERNIRLSVIGKVIEYML